MSRDEGYARAYHWFRREAVPALGLTPPQIAVYDVLVDRADDRGHSWPSQDLIAAESGQGVRAVRAALKALVNAGLVEVRPGTRQGNRYRVGMRPLLPPIEAPGAGMSTPDPVDNSAFAASGAGMNGAIAASRAGALRHQVPTKKEPAKDNHIRNSTLARAAAPMTDAQRQNVADALETIADRSDDVDVLALLPAEVAYLDGLPSDTRRKRIAAWAGLRSRAEQPGGGLEDDDRLHDLLTAHGHVRDDDTGPWATCREETA